MSKEVEEFIEDEDYIEWPTLKDNVFYLNWRDYKVEEYTEIPEELEESWVVWDSLSFEWGIGYKNIPKKFLPYALSTEAYTWIEYLIPEFIDVVKGALELVPEEIRREYIAWQIKNLKWRYLYNKKLYEDETDEKTINNNALVLKEIEDAIEYLKWILTLEETKEKYYDVMETEK